MTDSYLQVHGHISGLIVDREEDVGVIVIFGAGILGALLMLFIIGEQMELYLVSFLVFT